MDRSTHQRLIKLLLEKTHDPDDMVGWSNRMGRLAFDAGLQVEYMTWSGSPYMVATMIADRAIDGGFSKEVARLFELLQQ